LRYYGGVDPSLGDVADAVDRAVARLDDMLSVVLVAADALDPAGEPPEVVDLAAVLEHVVATLPPDQRGRVRTHVEGGTGRVVAVVRAIELILWFLLDNALRFSPEGTTVEVTARVAIRHVVFDVSDHGPGIPAEYMNWAFDPFTQADTSMVRERSGLGMGLYTARRLARKLGGDLTIASSDAGVLASVILPRRPDLPAAGDEPSATNEADDRVITVADIVRTEPDFFGFRSDGGAVSP
jgi:signal transduction histidine kinase